MLASQPIIRSMESNPVQHHFSTCLTCMADCWPLWAVQMPARRVLPRWLIHLDLTGDNRAKSPVAA